MLHAPVTKIQFDDTPKAVGVVYLDGTTGKTRELRARKEVILAGGAFDTPHLLQVSGIGPRDLLENIGVNVVSDNPHVGEDLWDHVSVPFVLKLAETADSLCLIRSTLMELNITTLQNCLESMDHSHGFCIYDLT